VNFSSHFIMRPRLRTRLATLTVATAIFGIGLDLPAQSASPASPPPIPREFRGAWVASVANIDWPSKPGLSAWQQQAELMAILDRARDLRLNAILLQVRPAGDALYASTLEPWSAYLTGVEGRPPEPYYDPLAFAVKEAHARGLELHAWFNPYRARHPSATGPHARTHLSVTHPHWVRRYGKYEWMDPGEPGVLAHSVKVALDVVKRYDVDGIHVDDYFYPYPETDSTKAEVPFPDSASYARYRAKGGALGLSDWRRWNVDRYVERVYDGTKRLKPWVRWASARSASGARAIRPASRASTATRSSPAIHANGCVRGGWTTSRRSCTGRSRARRRAIRCCSTGGLART
jgi:uncharacterized lipoprotein YddW (UPF0748 family)